MSILLEPIPRRDRICKVSFNEERNVLIGLTENGYRMINCCPVVTIVNKDICNNGFQSADIYKRSNIVAFAGSKECVKFQSSTVYIYNDDTDKEIAHIDFPAPIVRCYFKQDLLVVVLEKYTYIYNASSMVVYDVFRTYPNPNGICDIKFNESTPLIATLGEKKGTVRISTGKQSETVIVAHDSAIACLCLSEDGELLATSSVRGSVIRVFEVATRFCVSTIRRGHMRASIINIEFDRFTQYLMCNSDTTVHVARRSEDIENNRRLSSSSNASRSSLANGDGKRFFDGFFAESFVYRYSNPDKSKTMLAVFGSEPETVYLVTSKGLFQKLSIDGDKGLNQFKEIRVLDS